MSCGPDQSIVPLQVSPPTKAFEAISVNIMWPYLLTGKGNRFINGITDMFCRQVEARATPDDTAQQILTFLNEEVFARFGFSRVVLTDKGKQFTSRNFQEQIRIQLIGHTHRHVTTTGTKSFRLFFLI